MTAGTNDTLTLQRVLFGQGGSSMAGALHEDGVAVAMDARLEPVPPALRGIAREEIAKVVAAVLGTDVADVLKVGWRTWEQLTDAARRSLEEPGGSEIVELADHRITSIHRPHIDVEVDGSVVSAIGMEIEITIDLHGVTAVVSRGRLSALRSGRADVTADVAIEGVQVVVATTQIELPIEVPLGEGIALVDSGRTVGTPPPPDDGSLTTA